MVASLHQCQAQARLRDAPRRRRHMASSGTVVDTDDGQRPGARRSQQVPAQGRCRQLPRGARGWSNCAVLVSYLLGRSYLTWTPDGLYRRLKAEAEAEPIELSQFLCDHFQSVANRIADKTLKLLPRPNEEPLDEVLLGLGTAVMTAMMSSLAISLYKAAVPDSERFKDAAAAYWTFGPKRATDRTCEVLEDARRGGEIKVDDCSLSARRFVAMLLGDLLLEIVFGLRASPDPVEIHVMPCPSWPCSCAELVRLAACRLCVSGPSRLVRAAQHGAALHGSTALKGPTLGFVLHRGLRERAPQPH